MLSRSSFAKIKLSHFLVSLLVSCALCLFIYVKFFSCNKEWRKRAIKIDKMPKSGIGDNDDQDDVMGLENRLNFREPIRSIIFGAELRRKAIQAASGHLNNSNMNVDQQKKERLRRNMLLGGTRSHVSRFLVYTWCSADAALSAEAYLEEVLSAYWWSRVANRTFLLRNKRAPCDTGGTDENSTSHNLDAAFFPWVPNEMAWLENSFTREQM